MGLAGAGMVCCPLWSRMKHYRYQAGVFRLHVKHLVDLTQRMSLTQDTETVNYALLLSHAACYLLCQVLQKVL